MNSFFFFFIGGENAQLTKDKKWTVNTLNKAQQTYKNKLTPPPPSADHSPLQPSSSLLHAHSLFHSPHKRKTQSLQSAN